MLRLTTNSRSFEPAQVWKGLRAKGRIAPDDVLMHFDAVEPAIDVEAVARGLGARVERVFGYEHPGSIDTTGSRPIIKVRMEDHPVRQRFTIAHEIGHLMLHGDGQMFREDVSYGGGYKETQANNYAAELLMPDWLLDRALARTRGSVTKMASLFDVSELAMRYRLKNTGRIGR